MPRRAPSPALSENEVDIAAALFSDSAEVENGGQDQSNGFDLDFNDILNAGGRGDGSDGEGDEDFIASKLRSANRKSSNLQGKTVKKGGGFQAMGA